MAAQKNITLTSMADLRANSAEELLAARVSAADKRLMSLALRVNRDFRPSAPQFGRYLVAMAIGLRAEDADELAGRPAAADFAEGVIEAMALLTGRIKDEPLRSLLNEEANSTVTWRAGMDEDVMDAAAKWIGRLTEALSQARLGEWPVVFVIPGEGKVAWSMPQLIQVVESNLDKLELTVAEQEDKAAQRPKRP
jgi:hypothetical protein